MSMRKIATVLDTGSASLYVYVKDLNLLHALMLDTALEEVEDSPDLPAVERVKAILRSCLTVLLDRRGLAGIAAVTMPRGTGSMRLNELLLDGLLDAGVRPEPKPRTNVPTSRPSRAWPSCISCSSPGPDPAVSTGPCTA
ncbi:hypothetical protein [Streptomyces sp. NPDC058694]|uniref:hypothetical protein n=1 Tax=Streptomyces sp. NPDC058694 TaxID=3346603 RepID=UPI003661600F